MPDVWPMIEHQRKHLADDLDALSPEQWDAPSLCSGWTVRHVAAHLGMGLNVSLGSFLLRMLRNRFDFDRAADQYARSVTSSPRELAQDLRANAAHRFKPPGFGPEAPLTDLVVHGFDIFRALDIQRKLPPDHAAVVLDLLTSPKGGKAFGRKAPLDGLRLETTDTGWTFGSGELVSGAASDLILALAGRPVGLAGLNGSGAARLRG